MDLAWISLAALLIVVVASCTIRLNPGILAMALAWGVAGLSYVVPPEENKRSPSSVSKSTDDGNKSAPSPARNAGGRITFREMLNGFPVDLFLTLVGVTLLFTQAQVNGTLDRVTRAAVRLCRGNLGLIPMLFFALAAGLATIGAGNIAATALLAPVAMPTAHRARIPAFLMAIMIAHGALAGAMAPFAASGVIANDILRDRLNITGFEWSIYGYNFAANALVAFSAYFLFGGWRLFQQTYHETETSHDSPGGAESKQPIVGLERGHLATLAVIAAMIVAVVVWRAHVGMTALVGATVLTLCRFADEGQSIRKMPWAVILMVCGVTVLTSLLERTGGADRLVKLIGQVSNADTVGAVSAFLSGIISVYSSTSGVVFPAFLPLVPGLVAEVGGTPLALANSIIIGGSLVDSSPLSTIGALCVTSAEVTDDRQALFRQMLFWGLSMAFVGAAMCYVLF